MSQVPPVGWPHPSRRSCRLVIMGVYLLAAKRIDVLRLTMTSCRPPHCRHLSLPASAARPDLLSNAFTTEEKLSVSARVTPPNGLGRWSQRPDMCRFIFAQGCGDRDRAGAHLRNAARRGAVACQVLRSRDDLATVRAADSAPRHHHRYIAPLAFDIMGIVLDMDHRARARQVLHRGGYNNAIARFRRLSRNLVEASMDLGANGFQTFRHVILP